MVYRTLGRTGIRASVFGFGGIVCMDATARQAADDVAMAFEHGVNYFDVAPSYGNAQYMLGPALKPYRDRVSLACKSGKRTGKELRAELEESLRALHTDHFDVYQLHGIDDEGEIDTALAPGGALEEVLKARDQGLVRFVGFSCHHERAALRLMEAFDFDTVLFPINWAYYLEGGAGEAVLRRAAERDMGRLAIKGLAQREWREGEDRSHAPKCWYRPIDENTRLAELALLFTLSRDVHVAISPGQSHMLREGLRVLAKYPELSFTPEMEAELRELAGQEEGILFSKR